MNTRHRVFAPDLSPPTVVLGEMEAHHALHVLRLKTGYIIQLFDGRGGSATGRITSTTRRDVQVAIEDTQGSQPRPHGRIHLAFAPPKGKRLDWLLEKTSELGVASLQMLVCERSVVQPEANEAALRRYQAICVSAIRQSRQLFLPAFAAPVNFAQFIGSEFAGLGILANGGEQTPLLAHLEIPAAVADVTLLVGPEGGWTPAEYSQALEAGFAPARLGQSTLRVETAAVAMAAALRLLLDMAHESVWLAGRGKKS